MGACGTAGPRELSNAHDCGRSRDRPHDHWGQEMEVGTGKEARNVRGNSTSESEIEKVSINPTRSPLIASYVQVGAPQQTRWVNRTAQPAEGRLLDHEPHGEVCVSAALSTKQVPQTSAQGARSRASGA